MAIRIESPPITITKPATSKNRSAIEALWNVPMTAPVILEIPFGEFLVSVTVGTGLSDSPDAPEFLG